MLSGLLCIKQINCDPDHLTPLDNKSPCAGCSLWVCNNTHFSDDYILDFERAKTQYEIVH